VNDIAVFFLNIFLIFSGLIAVFLYGWLAFFPCFYTHLRRQLLIDLNATLTRFMQELAVNYLSFKPRSVHW